MLQKLHPITVKHIPTTDDLSLSLTYGNIVADDDKLDAIRLVGVRRGVLLLGQSKVEDIASVVPSSADSITNTTRRMEVLRHT